MVETACSFASHKQDKLMDPDAGLEDYLATLFDTDLYYLSAGALGAHTVARASSAAPITSIRPKQQPNSSGSAAATAYQAKDQASSPQSVLFAPPSLEWPAAVHLAANTACILEPQDEPVPQAYRCRSGGATTRHQACKVEAAAPLETGPTRTMPVDSAPQSGLKRPLERSTSSSKKGSKPRDTRTQLMELEAVLQERQQEVAMLALENIKLKRRTRLLECMVKCRDEQLRMLQEIKEAIAQHGLPVLAPGQPVPEEMLPMSDDLSLQHILVARSMTPTQLLGFFRGASTQLSSLLVEVESVGADSSPAALKKLKRMVSNVVTVSRYTRLIAPQSMLLQSKPCTPQLEEIASESHWQYVVESLKLTLEQQKDLAALLEMYTQWCLKGRVKLDGQLSRLTDAVFTSHDPQVMVMQLQTVELLHQMLLQERCLLMLVDHVFKDLLEPIQMARLLVHSYPYMPDVLAILSTVAKGEDLEDGAEL